MHILSNQICDNQSVICREQHAMINSTLSKLIIELLFYQILMLKNMIHQNHCLNSK